MTSKADDFFNSVNYTSILDTVKGIFTSDGSIAVLMDFERVFDAADLYAFKNWELGELVQGPVTKRYSTNCMFMWPYKLMPDPRGAKRLLALGCTIQWKKTSIKVPVQVKGYDDFQAGTNYPKMADRSVWLISIDMPKELMEDIKEGSIDLAGQSIDLNDLDQAYADDLHTKDQDGSENGGNNQQSTPGQGGANGDQSMNMEQPNLGGI